MANAVLETCVETREDEEISPHKSFEEENEYYRLESVPIAFEEPEKTSRGGKGLRKRAKRATTGAAVRAANGAKMSKRKPTVYEEPKWETTPDEESEEENKSTDGESKKTSPGGELEDNNNPGGNSPGGKGWKTIAKRAAIGAAIGAGVALFGIPACISALGFKAGGIAAGSIAAKMMSAAAIANGGGVAAGSTVAVLQSIGAAGFSTGTTAVLTTGLGSLGAVAGASLPVQEEDSSDKSKKS
ncbi:uncharacterized protein LOC135402376 [Pseudopipra pipra]|uniref:uncharacterized protein LOC135402376 n=1 Tax=Pseudopipra pipra TaxID=415032 RepID=UPI00313A43B6